MVEVCPSFYGYLDLSDSDSGTQKVDFSVFPECGILRALITILYLDKIKA